MHRCLLLVAILFLHGVLSAHAVSPVHKRVLDNGLTILVREDPSAPVVTAQAWVRAGSITEAEWMGAGLSHVLEHMLFKGTKTRGVAQIAQEIENKGGYINAYTSFEQTVYYINIPSENWTTAVDILADCMMNATIPAEELLKEKQVILREMAMNEDNPDRRASRQLWATAYTVHPYRHPVIGYPDVYNRTTRDDVFAYYQRHYIPNNMMFVVVGNVQATEVIAHIAELTKDFKMGALPPAYVPAEPPQLNTRRRDEPMAVQLSQAHLAWHIPALTHPDVYALDALAIILGGGRSSRLYRELVEQRGLLHSVNAFSWTPRHPGLFAIDASMDPDKREDAITAIRTEIDRLATKSVTPAELEKAIKVSTAQFVSRLKTMDGQAADIGSSELQTGDPNFSDKYLQNLQRVTVGDIRRVARQYFTDDNLTITTLNPLVASATTAAATTTTNAIQIQRFTFPNGLRLLVREDPKLPLVDFRAVLKGGVIAESPANNGVTKLTARSLLKGTKTRSAEQIADTIESVGGDISYFAGNNSFGVTTQVLRDDFDRGLEVFADVLQNPTFPAELVTREREVQLAEIKADQDKIMPVAQQILRETIFTKHPYRLSAAGQLDSVTKLQRADLIGFHRQYVTPNNMVICVFGDVNAEEVRRKIGQKFGRLKPGTIPLAAAAAERLSENVRKEETRPKQQAVLLIGFSGADMFSPDRFALELLDTAYSGQGSRVFLRIRDELGLAYYVGAYQLLGLDTGYFGFYVGTTGDQVATCEKEFFAELDKLKIDGLSEEELTRAKNGLIGQQKVALQDNSTLSLTVGLDELYGLGYDYFTTTEQRYRAVTVADIKRVANNYFGDKPHAVVIVKPEPNK